MSPTNKVEVQGENLIEVSLCGRQSAESIAEIMQQIEEADQKECRILIDLREYVRADTLEVRKAVYEAFKSLDYKKIALFGGDKTVQRLLSLITLAGRRAKVIQHFGSRAQALKWLKT